MPESGRAQHLVTCCKSLPWPVKRASCTDFVAGSRTTLSTFCNNLLLQDRFDSRVVKRPTPLFDSFLQKNVAKQVARFVARFSVTLVKQR